MGDDTGRFDEQPAHAVWVRPFLLGRFPVTNRDYGCYLAATGFEPPRFWADARFSAPDQPVVGVSWFEASAYCRWLGEMTQRAIRLPTEAEREWASRGGLPRALYPWGDEEPRLEGAWALGAAGQDRPLPVSEAAPNGYGLYHMADNVHEWCSDWWDPNYYAVSPEDNPTGPLSGTRRASRGGAWRHQRKFCRCSARSSLDPAFRYNDYGFRVAADA
jgi:formylglycine-generating enzyme required for sulfatase activity